jgi:hypothetical protein
MFVYSVEFNQIYEVVDFGNGKTMVISNDEVTMTPVFRDHISNLKYWILLV